MKNRKKFVKSLGTLGAVACLGLGLVACNGDNPSTSQGDSNQSTNSNFDTSKTIKLYTRDRASGTRDGFFTGIGFEEAKADNTKLRNGYVEVATNGDMITAVKNDEYGIGYVSLSSLENSGVKGLIYEGVEPTVDNVINESYKLTRNFNYCIRSTYQDPRVEELVDAFIAYMNTYEGQSTIESEGGIIKTPAEQSWQEIKSQYSVITEDTKGITVKIGGSTSVKSIVDELVTEFNAIVKGGAKFEYNGTGSSDAYKGIVASESDAKALHIGFASREFKSDEVLTTEQKGTMCTDAIVPVVNIKNLITQVTALQLKAMYGVDGNISKWSDVK